MSSDRKTAIQVVMATVTGFSLADQNTHDETNKIIMSGMNALIVLGVSMDELDEAIRDAPYLMGLK